ncbi:MAG: peptidase U32 family protein [Nanoarchaeota archaeon]|nr:peptidase U32 family protein [Nanoarchaeota archaeon]
MKPEILAPVGNWEMLSAAIEAGTDAVYFGTKQLTMRISCNNFQLTEFKKVVEKCHEHHVKAYLTVNTLVFDDEIDKVRQILESAKEANIDAIICWDMATITLAKEYNLEIHLSTQASVANFEALKEYYKLGVRRVILARELSLEQIKSIKTKIKKENLDMEIETFIHGAMCVAVSGRCFLSQDLFGKSANRGNCLQTCRRAYKATDIEEGHELEINNNFVLSAKDLCTLPFIEQLVDAGIDSFKIEGRHKGPEYVKTIIKVYKEVIEFFLNNKNDLNNNNNNNNQDNNQNKKNQEFKELKEKGLEKLKQVFNRKFSTGFYMGTPTNEDITNIYGSASTTKKVYIGIVKNFYQKINVAEIKVESGELNTGDQLLFTGPTTGAKYQTLDSMELDHNKIKKAKKGTRIAMKLEFQARPNDKVFIIRQIQ